MDDLYTNVWSDTVSSPKAEAATPSWHIPSKHITSHEVSEPVPAAWLESADIRWNASQDLDAGWGKVTSGSDKTPKVATIHETVEDTTTIYRHSSSTSQANVIPPIPESIPYSSSPAKSNTSGILRSTDVSPPQLLASEIDTDQWGSVWADSQSRKDEPEDEWEVARRKAALQIGKYMAYQ